MFNVAAVPASTVAVTSPLVAFAIAFTSAAFTITSEILISTFFANETPFEAKSSLSFAALPVTAVTADAFTVTEVLPSRVNKSSADSTPAASVKVKASFAVASVVAASKAAASSDVKVAVTIPVVASNIASISLVPVVTDPAILTFLFPRPV